MRALTIQQESNLREVVVHAFGGLPSRIIQIHWYCQKSSSRMMEKANRYFCYMMLCHQRLFCALSIFYHRVFARKWRLQVCNDISTSGRDDYDATDDFAKSIDEAYRVIRERKAAGGKGWEPK